VHIMKATKQRFSTVLMLAAFSASAWAQTSTPPATTKSNSATATAPAQPAITAADVQSLKDALAAQQQQIQQLNQQLEAAQLNWRQAQAAADAAEGEAAAAQAQVNQEQQAVGELKTDLAGLKTVNYSGANQAGLQNAVFSMQGPAQVPSGDQQVYNKEMESPITIRFRGINITPGGYAEAAFVRRSRALGADLPTPFNSLTAPGASQSQLSEFFGSARQSKATVFVDGRLGNVDLSSYISGDFLSAGVTSTATETNSYTFRLRQAWAQAKFNEGWSFLGGQAWSLVTEDAVGIAPDDDMGKTNDVRPKTIDPSYNVGFVFARQWGLRLTRSFGDKVAVAFAVENPQATVTSHDNANNYLISQPGASNSYNTTATYGFNPSPDLIAKIAFDPGFGHYEIFGLYDRFTDRVFPCEEYQDNPTLCAGLTSASAFGAYNASKNGGGVGASARWNFAKHISFGLKGFGGSGIGRYAPGGLADASINPDGTVHLIKNLEGLASLEVAATKKLSFYGYGGVEYAGRSWGVDDTNPSAPVEVGYGAPGFNNTGCSTEQLPGTSGLVSGPVAGSLKNCTFDTRALMEGTIGFWYRFYSGPRGSFRFGTQYSYVTRNSWSGTGGLPTGSAGLSTNGIDGMVFTSFRYYLP
jgi:hypothetical protein